MTKKMSEGTCIICKGIFGKRGMTRHLKACKERKAAIEKSLRKKRSKRTRIFHIAIEDRYLHDYWMHLEIPANATLDDLDDFLRETWVECCGHMSAFNIEDMRYITGSGVDSMWIGLFVPGGDSDMNVPVGNLLSPGLKFSYEYDFGTTTELILRVIADREGNDLNKSILLMARNEPPLIPCEKCGKPATRVCTQCLNYNKGWVCNTCSKKHKCGREYLLPVVNSPRVGMCAYSG